MSSETIENETFKQLEAARKQISELEVKLSQFDVSQFTTVHSMSFNSYFAVDQNLPKSIEISGIALSEGTWNGIFYPSGEIQKIEKSLVGAPMLVEHGKDRAFEKREVGKFTECKWEPMIDALLYKAVVTDPEAIAMVKAGKLPAVSMSNQLYYYPAGGKIVAKDLNLVEGSLVAVPACQTCYISKTKENLSKLYGNSFKQTVADNTTVKKEEVLTMSENKKITYLSEQEFSKDFPEVFNLKVEDLNAMFEVLAPGKMKFTRSEVVENADNKGKSVRYWYKLSAAPEPVATPVFVGKKTLSMKKNGVDSVLEVSLTADQLKAELGEFETVMKGTGIPSPVTCPKCGMGFTDSTVMSEHEKTHAFTAGSGIPMQATEPKVIVPQEVKPEMTPPPAAQTIGEPNKMFDATGGSQTGAMSAAPVTSADPKMTASNAKCTCGKTDCKECNPPKEEKKDMAAETKTEVVVETKDLTVDGNLIVKGTVTAEAPKETASLSNITEGEAILEIIKRYRH